MDSVSHCGLVLLFSILLLDTFTQIGAGVSYFKFWRKLWKVYRMRPTMSRREHHFQRVSVVIAAYNEEHVIEKTVSALLKNDYPDLEVIVVDDGSTDRTLPILSSIASRSRNVLVIGNKENLGKCRSIEAGVELSSGRIICLIDADTVVCRRFVSDIVYPILAGEAEATCGNVKVGNRTNALTRFQSIEYVSILNRIRAFQDISGFITTMPGAACAFQKSILAAVGGYSSGSLAEDTDFTIRLALNNKRIRFVPCAVAYTEVPSSWKSLLFQRKRWVFGNIQCILEHLLEWRRRPEKPLYGFPMFMYENAGRPIFEFTRNIVVVILVYLGYHDVFFILAISLCINAMRTMAIYILEREDFVDVLYMPARFAVWPLFNIAPLLLAALHILLKQGVSWNKLERSGDVAERQSDDKVAPLREFNG